LHSYILDGNLVNPVNPNRHLRMVSPMHPLQQCKSFWYPEYIIVTITIRSFFHERLEIYLRNQLWDGHRKISQTEFWCNVRLVGRVESPSLMQIHLCLNLNHQSWKLLGNWSEQNLSQPNT
jgi:hypothetical protein